MRLTIISVILSILSCLKKCPLYLMLNTWIQSILCVPPKPVFSRLQYYQAQKSTCLVVPLRTKNEPHNGLPAGRESRPPLHPVTAASWRIFRSFHCRKSIGEPSSLIHWFSITRSPQQELGCAAPTTELPLLSNNGAWKCGTRCGRAAREYSLPCRWLCPTN